MKPKNTSATPCRVLHLLPDLQRGGGQQLLLRLLAGADSAQFRHIVAVFLSDDAMATEFEALGVHVWFLHHHGLIPWRTLNRLVRTIQRERIDILHINGTPLDKIYGQIAAIFTGLPVVYTIHGTFRTPTRLRPRLSRLVRQGLERVLDPWTIRAVIAVSEAVRNSWWPLLRSHGISGQIIRVQPNGVPLDQFRPPETTERQSLRASAGLAPDQPVLISVGRLSTMKGQHFLLRMTDLLRSEHPRVRLLLVGDGPSRKALEQEVRERLLEANVEFLGHRNDVSDLMKMSDIFVHGSIYEGLPLVLLEAMGCGLPVVAFDLPGLDAVVREGESGYLVPLGDVAQMAQRVGSVCGSTELAGRMGHAGRSIVEAQHDIRDGTGTLETVYREVVRQEASRNIVQA